MSAGKRNSAGITTDLLMISARKIIVNVKKLTGRLRGAKGELPQEISSRGGGYTTCKFNIFKNDKCQKNELRFKRGSGVESIRGAGHNKNPKLQL